MKEIYVQPNIQITALAIENSLMAGSGLGLHDELGGGPALGKQAEFADEEWEDEGLSEGRSTNLWAK